ncbi:hypothetical protein EVAR_57586_1 [Eumeta japonica]|uniref:Uncharacterized protein n=1 Tax=Eumeta variegata TaxID=151549 RepID=A0A4C1Z889_EUMVA|nr:hypothetical protein EVAR_57586_1 [Eumeta japonica]
MLDLQNDAIEAQVCRSRDSNSLILQFIQSEETKYNNALALLINERSHFDSPKPMPQIMFLGFRTQKNNMAAWSIKPPVWDIVTESLTEGSTYSTCTKSAWKVCDLYLSISNKKNEETPQRSGNIQSTQALQITGRHGVTRTESEEG